MRFRDGRSVHEFIAQSLRRALSADTDPGEGRTREVLAIAASQAHRQRGDVRGHVAAYGALRAAVMEESGCVDQGLGVVLDHVDRRYLIARNARGLIVVDARRGLRRVVVERLRTALASGDISARPLLVPVAVSVDEATAERLESQAATLEKFGFDLRRVAHDSVSCRGIPASLASVSPQELIATLGRALMSTDARVERTSRLPAVLDAVVEHCDLSAAWSWDRATMNELLRDLERIENTSHTQSDEIIWRQLEADDIAVLLARGRSFAREMPAPDAKSSG